MKKLNICVITGLSGAGKSQAAKFLEDLGFFCVDNMPTTLIPKFVEICAQGGSKIDKVALVVDIREGEFLDNLLFELDKLKQGGFKYQILFLEASNEALIRRYSESRRKHPFSKTGYLCEDIEAERERLAPIRSQADFIVDTSESTVGQLKEELARLLLGKEKRNSLLVTIISFGFKHGIPLDSDLIFDVRFLPNPNYVSNLRNYTGNDKRVRDYVLSWPQSMEFLNKLSDLIVFLLPYYFEEGKSRLTLSFGCTGGKHRAVVIANELKKFMDSQGQDVKLRHRDIEKE